MSGDRVAAVIEWLTVGVFGTAFFASHTAPYLTQRNAAVLVSLILFSNTSHLPSCAYLFPIITSLLFAMFSRVAVFNCTYRSELMLPHLPVLLPVVADSAMF